MAFCPNCGTPNTEQAANCVNCGNALTPPADSSGSKFKGTIMMGAVPPGGPAAKQPQPAQSPAAPSPAAQPAGGSGKNLAYQKTMVGGMAAPAAPAVSAPSSAASPAAAPSPPGPALQSDPSDLGTAATVEQSYPGVGGAGMDAQARPSGPQASPMRFSEEPRLPESGATKMMLMVLGGAVILAAIIVGAALMMRGGGDEQPAPGAEPAETS